MVGGDVDAFARAEPMLRSLAVHDGVIHAGPAGAGHFVKQIHNAIDATPDSTAGKAVALLRHGFGEHPLHTK